MENSIDIISSYTIEDIKAISIPDVTQMEDIEIASIEGIGRHIKNLLIEAENGEIETTPTYIANLKALNEKMAEFIQTVRDAFIDTSLTPFNGGIQYYLAMRNFSTQTLFPNNVNDIFNVPYFDVTL